ncbi:uncharacterized protein DFL_008954 [Arthrobotrys flagrans]|uniref:Uncharacterized protein n=1 Tax=Arthrobotrys flagrans TaxID=97331 RepID=A0A436ZQ88_ARTFL|nr:hypothetical protein DFL_008954 [Arthrobotrys flagrans]
MEDCYKEASRAKGRGSYDLMIDIVSKGIKTTTVFDEIRDVISAGLRELETILCQENQKWCQEIGDELETNIKNWTSVSEKLEKDEMEEKAKLKAIVSGFEIKMKDIVAEANQLAEQVKVLKL